MTQKPDTELAAEFETAWSDPTRFTEHHVSPTFQRLVDASTVELAEAIQAARDEGYSWTAIGYALGTPKC